jgi:hypothetical protein
MAKPSPAPWKTEYDQDAFAPTIVILAADGTPIAEVLFADRHPVATPTDTALANAKLLAAAPTMLHALRKVMDYALVGAWIPVVVDAIRSAEEDDRTP